MPREPEYDWTFIEPYLDNQIEVSSRNRELPYMTPRQFRDSILVGKKPIDLIREGFSKHLVSFLSKLSQGKFHLSKDEFASVYENGTSLDEMAKAYGLKREEITFLRALYGIRCKGATFQKRKLMETSLTPRQKEILYGSLLGDAKRTSSSSVGFCQGTKQRDYLLWKYLEFENVASALPKDTVYKGESGSSLHNYSFYTKANTDVEKAVGLFYGQGSKEVCEEILDALTPLSLAVWYQDDGSVGFNERLTASPALCCSFCTESFSVESCLLLRRWMKSKYDIDTILRNRHVGKGTFRIHAAGISDSEKLASVIKPYLLPMFQYKVDHAAYVSWEERKASGFAYEEPDMLKALENMRQERSKQCPTPSSV